MMTKIVALCGKEYAERVHLFAHRIDIDLFSAFWVRSGC